MSCLKWNCRLPGRQLEGRTPTRALTCCGCCLKHAGAPVTHGCSPAAAHRTPQTHTEQGAPQPGKQKRNFRGRQDGLCWWGTGHGFFTKPLFAISGLLKKKQTKNKKWIIMLAAASVGFQEQSWMWLLCMGHDCTSPTPSIKKDCLLQWKENVWGFICFVFTIRH